MNKHSNQPDRVNESAVQLIDQEWKQIGLDEASLEQSKQIVDIFDSLAASGRPVENILKEWEDLSAAEILSTRKASMASEKRKERNPDLTFVHGSAHLLYYLVISNLLQFVLKELIALEEELRNRHERAPAISPVQTAIQDWQQGIAKFHQNPGRALEDLNSLRSALGAIKRRYNTSPAAHRAFRAATLGYELLEYDISYVKRDSTPAP